MKRQFFKLITLLLPFGAMAQNTPASVSSYVKPYAGIVFQGAQQTSQTGTAHKRGNYNEYETDFDLNVHVKGNSKSGIGASYGITYGSTWKKEGRKFNPGFEFDIFHITSTHTSKLSNPNTEIVSNVIGAIGDSVLILVEEHYGAGHHTFDNSMKLSSWNAAANLTLSYAFSSKISLNGGLGVGFSAVTLKDAESKQSSPAPAVPGFETTMDNGGDVVNHFNSRPNASCNVPFGQLRIGGQIQLTNCMAMQIDARSIYRGQGNYNFGSTIYSDHAPTNNWEYTIEKGMSHSVNVGIALTL